MKKNIALFAAAALVLAGSVASCNHKPSKEELAAQQKLDQRLDGLKGNAEEGAAYIEEQLKADPELKKTQSGLVYKITKAGEGETFKQTDNVTVKYKGAHIDGSVFDDGGGQPQTFPVAAVVPGFGEMLMLMRPGAVAHCIIPGNLGYGERGAGSSIGPNETLVFDIEAIGVAEK